MRFPNAQAGVSKLYTSQILALIALACTVIASILIAVGSLVGLAIFTIIGAVISVIAFIFMIIGLGQAQKDDALFKTAFWCVIGALVLQVIASIFATSSPVVSAVLGIIASIANLLVIFFVIKAIQRIAEQLGDSALVAKAKRLFMIVLILNIVGFVLSFVSGLIQANPTALAVAGILGIVGGIVEIVSVILYIQLLKHAKESFKA